MNPSTYTWKEWANLAIFAIGTVTSAAWYTAFVGADKAAVISGILASVAGILNFMVNGKPAEPAA